MNEPPLAPPREPYTAPLLESTQGYAVVTGASFPVGELFEDPTEPL